MATKPLVGVLMGSDSDWPTMKAAADVLREYGVPFEARVLSAHRTPEQTADVVALILSSNHYPGGATELTPAGAPQKTTPLGEPQK